MPDEIKTFTHADWLDLGRARFGENFDDWRFVCPICGVDRRVPAFQEAGRYARKRGERVYRPLSSEIPQSVRNGRAEHSEKTLRLRRLWPASSIALARGLSGRNRAPLLRVRRVTLRNMEVYDEDHDFNCYAETAYETHKAELRESGARLPTWLQLKPEIQSVWVAAIKAAIERFWLIETRILRK